MSVLNNIVPMTSRQALIASVSPACLKCGGPGISPEISKTCPKCGAVRPPDIQYGEIWRRQVTFRQMFAEFFRQLWRSLWTSN